MRVVEPPQQRQPVALCFGRNVLLRRRRPQVRERLRAARVDDCALVCHRQKAGAEVSFLVVRQPLRVRQHHKRGEVVRFATERIADPRPETRETRQQKARVHQVASRSVDVGPRHHGHQERHVIHARCQMRQQTAHPAAALPVPFELKARLEHGARFAGGRFHAFACARIKLLPVTLHQLGFVVEQIHLACAAVHEKLDHAFRPRRVMRPAAQHSTNARARCLPRHALIRQ